MVDNGHELTYHSQLVKQDSMTNLIPRSAKAVCTYEGGLNIYVLFKEKHKEHHLIHSCWTSIYGTGRHWV